MKKRQLNPGEVFNRWTVMYEVPTPEGLQSGTYAMARCTCGTEKVVKGANMWLNISKSCGCWDREQSSRLGKSRKGAPGQGGFNKVWLEYKGSAKKRGLEFTITKEQLKVWTKQACVYCGDTESASTTHTSGKYIAKETLENSRYNYNGLDRVDSSKGYTPDNVVVCCKRCNWMKNDMTQPDFLAHIKKIADRMI